MKSANLYKGTLATIILKLLSESDKLYGYEIVKKVKEITKGELEITEGALYPTLHKLEANGWVVTEKVSVGKRVRKYYKLTKSGVKETEEKIEELMAFLSSMYEIFEKTTV